MTSCNLKTPFGVLWWPPFGAFLILKPTKMDFISEAIHKAAQEALLKIEQMLIAKLKDNGFYFDSIEELHKFLKTRVMIVENQSIKTVYVDYGKESQKLIFRYTEPQFKFDNGKMSYDFYVNT